MFSKNQTIHLYCKTICGLLLCIFAVGCQISSSPDKGYYSNAPIPVKTVSTPEYEVQYRYIQPDNEASLACIEQCDERYEACQDSTEGNVCREEYHSCFRLCGGQVEQNRICIKNCQSL